MLPVVMGNKFEIPLNISFLIITCKCVVAPCNITIYFACLLMLIDCDFYKGITPPGGQFLEKP